MQARYRGQIGRLMRPRLEAPQQVFQNTVDIWDSQKTFEKMTLFRDPSPLWLLQAEQPIGRVGPRKFRSGGMENRARMCLERWQPAIVRAR